MLYIDEPHDAMLHQNENKSKTVSLLHLRETSMTKRRTRRVNDRIFDASQRLFKPFDVLGVAEVQCCSEMMISSGFNAYHALQMHFVAQ